MPRKKEKHEADCCQPKESVDSIYEIEAVATVDERGQMVLPKAIRDKAGIKAGDKLAIVTLVRDGKVCCIHLFRSEDLANGARDILEPQEG
ncbi:MAG: AbrB/MazE/SpoVT family DNA-binding domain-containing protein [Methanomassiliicoccus sp.]|nr:MAG: AbrB/MazE/SpoVT family DNA-binding domain-containing protein [Methanomassiliicoccus sp.]